MDNENVVIKLSNIYKAFKIKERRRNRLHAFYIMKQSEKVNKIKL
jgi:hypothetical protein